MTTIENDQTYAFIADNLPASFVVYIDSSYNYIPDLRAHKASAYAVGWVIKNKQTNGVLGYGSSQIWSEPANDSSIAEMKGILAFLDVFSEYFPKDFQKTKKITIFCDNKMLVGNISNEFLQSGENWGEKRYGKDYLRFADYSSKVTIRSNWVKGHSGDTHNGIADSLASSTFKAMVSGEDFFGKTRRSYIYNRLTAAGVVNKKKVKTIFDIEKRSPEEVVDHSTRRTIPYTYIYVGSTVSAKKGKVVAFSYLAPEIEEHGLKIEKFPSNSSKETIALRSFSFVIFSHRMSENFNPKTPILIRSSDKEVISKINGFINEGLVEDEMNPDTLEALEHLREMVKGIEVGFMFAPFNETMNRAGNVASIALEAHAKNIDQDDEDYKNRIATHLRKAFR